MSNNAGESWAEDQRTSADPNHDRIIRGITQTLNKCEKQVPGPNVNIPRVGPDSHTSIRERPAQRVKGGNRTHLVPPPQKS